MTTEEKTCRCGVVFSLEKTGTFADSMMRFITLCGSCRDLEEELAKKTFIAAARMEKENDWRKFCPPIFQETEIEKLPRPDKAKQVLEWSGERGLMLHGETRKGKSRCAWLLLKKHFIAGRSVRVLDSMSGFEYASAFSCGANYAEAWVKERCACSMLFMDDVFKVKLTDSFEAAMFAILDYRLNHKKQIIATCNDTGETLQARMSGDRGAAFVARLKECCEIITF